MAFTTASSEGRAEFRSDVAFRAEVAAQARATTLNINAMTMPAPFGRVGIGVVFGITRDVQALAVQNFKARENLTIPFVYGGMRLAPNPTAETIRFALEQEEIAVKAVEAILTEEEQQEAIGLVDAIATNPGQVAAAGFVVHGQLAISALTEAGIIGAQFNGGIITFGQPLTGTPGQVAGSNTGAVGKTDAVTNAQNDFGPGQAPPGQNTDAPDAGGGVPF